MTVTVDDTYLMAIADAIREKSGSEATYKPREMAAAIREIGGDDALIGLLDGNITELNVPNGTTEIVKYGCAYRSDLVAVTLPETVTTIGMNAFQDCTDLETINLPSGLTSLGYAAFDGCEFLSSITEIPKGVTTISGYTFGSNAMTTFTLHENVKTIMNSAFNNCYNLAEVTFKGTPNSIGSSAFQSCWDLKTINVPWAKGAVENAPWGAPSSATINYGNTG